MNIYPDPPTHWRQFWKKKKHAFRFYREMGQVRRRYHKWSMRAAHWLNGEVKFSKRTQEVLECERKQKWERRVSAMMRRAARRAHRGGGV